MLVGTCGLQKRWHDFYIQAQTNSSEVSCTISDITDRTYNNRKTMMSLSACLNNLSVVSLVKAWVSTHSVAWSWAIFGQPCLWSDYFRLWNNVANTRQEVQLQ